LRYVLDCSVAVRWFVPQTHSELALRFLETLRERHNAAVAPDVIVPELGHVLRKLVVGKKLTPEQAALALERFLNVRLELAASATLAAPALQLALGHSATFYDALYVALAARDDLQVLTADDRMVSAFAKLDRVVRLADLPAS
jgi:predicted nucleic acid-binding protein